MVKMKKDKKSNARVTRSTW